VTVDPVARRTTIRALFAAIAAVAVLGMVVASASDDPPPTSVRAAGGDSAERSSATTDVGAPEETSPSPASTDVTEPTGSTRTPTRTRTTWGRTLSAGDRSAAGAGSGGTTTTTAPTAPTTTLPALAPPPAPAEGHAQFWGRVVDEAGQPVRGACVSMLPVMPPGSPMVVVQSKADGSYLIDVEVPWDDGIPFSVGARMCPGDERYLLTAIADKPATEPRVAKPGSSHRTEMWMPFGATTVDVTFVDPNGRPVLGLCGNTDTGTERWVADERGHIRIERPPYRNLHVAVQGACDDAVGVWDAAYSYGWDDFPLTGGANSVTYVVPWQSGDRAGEAVTINDSPGDGSTCSRCRPSRGSPTRRASAPSPGAGGSTCPSRRAVPS
jgi:hypothetical protein